MNEEWNEFKSSFLHHKILNLIIESETCFCFYKDWRIQMQAAAVLRNDDADDDKALNIVMCKLDHM